MDDAFKELPIYLEKSLLSTVDASTPSFVSSNSITESSIYKKIATIRKDLLFGCIRANQSIHQVLDKYFGFEKWVQETVERNPEMTNKSIGPIPKAMLILMGGFGGAFLSRYRSRLSHITFPLLGLGLSFTLCYPKTTSDFFMNGEKSISPRQLKENSKNLYKTSTNWMNTKFEKYHQKWTDRLSQLKKWRNKYEEQMNEKVTHYKKSFQDSYHKVIKKKNTSDFGRHQDPVSNDSPSHPVPDGDDDNDNVNDKRLSTKTINKPPRSEN